jgi:ParB-like chromosome segregation protein Spo0J
MPSSTPESDSRLAVQLLPLASIHPDPANPRRHGKRQIQQIAASIRAFGFNVPVLVDATGRLIAGHGRLAAAESLGWRAVPAIRLEHLTDAQLRAYQIADNRLAEISQWDDALLAESLKQLSLADLEFSLEVTGFDMGEIDLRIEAVGGSKSTEPEAADAIPPVTDTATTEPGDLWLLGPHRLLCADSLQAASYDRLMAGQRASVVFEDPPYNVRIDGHVGGKGAIHHREFAMASGELSSTEFVEFLTTAFRHAARHSKPGSIHFQCMDFRHLREILAAGFAVYSELKNLCIWAKNVGGMGSLYRSRHELIFVFKNGTAPHINNVELGRHGRNRTNVWEYKSIASTRQSTDEGDLLALHPTVKPVRLVADALLDCSHRGDIVLDAFLGSGSTLIAAQRVGRVCYGMELDPLYIDTAIRRWHADTGQDAVHAASGETFTQRQQRAVEPAQEVSHV